MFPFIATTFLSLFLAHVLLYQAVFEQDFVYGVVWNVDAILLLYLSFPADWAEFVFIIGLKDDLFSLFID